MSRILNHATAVAALALAAAAGAGGAQGEPRSFHVNSTDLASDGAIAKRADRMATLYCSDERALVQRVKCEADARQEAVAKLNDVRAVSVARVQNGGAAPVSATPASMTFH